MAWQLNVPVHEQDSFDESLDAAVVEHDKALGIGGLSEDDLRLRDFAVRKAKEIMAEAPIVSTHTVATISGHANSGGNVHIPGSGTSPGLTISVAAAAAYPQVVPLAQQEQSAPVAPPEALTGRHAGIDRHVMPGHQGVLTATGRQAVPSVASPSVPSTDEVEAPGAVEEPEVVPTVAPVEQPAEPVEQPPLGGWPAASGTPNWPAPVGGDAPVEPEGAPFVG
jgi:hypothetical protein